MEAGDTAEPEVEAENKEYVYEFLGMELRKLEFAGEDRPG